MTGHRPFVELTKGFSAERKAKIAKKATALREEMRLKELRRLPAACAKVVKEVNS